MGKEKKEEKSLKREVLRCGQISGSKQETKKILVPLVCGENRVEEGLREEWNLVPKP